MGLVNSRLLLDNGRLLLENNGISKKDRDTPVMGDGYCPIYDAALVGDWKRLVKLCEAAAINENKRKSGNDNGNKGRDDKGCDEGNAEELESNAGEESCEYDDLELTNRIASMDVFNGGHDYSFSADMSFRHGPRKPTPYGDLHPSHLDLKQLGDEEEGLKEIMMMNPNSDNGTHITEQESQSKDEASGSVGNSLHSQGEEEEQQQQPFILFVDAKGNTPLHLACRRDPPLHVIQALLSLHTPSVWMTTHDGWIPLHLACHCGCDAEVANELLNAMEDSIEEKNKNSNNDNSQQRTNNEEEVVMAEEGEGAGVYHEAEEVDPLLPRDAKGRTPLHLACASSRDPRRRPDLVRLLLLRSQNPKKAALARDWVDFDQRMGLDLALGDLKVLVGHLNVEFDPIVDDEDGEDGGSDAGSSDTDCKKVGAVNNGARNRSDGSTSIASKRERQSSVTATVVGRTPLNLIEDDYREELEEALLPGFSIANAIKACKGEDVDESSINAEHLNAMYECWSMLSLLLLAAGTPGTSERAKQALGGVTEFSETIHQSSSDDDCNALIEVFSKQCPDVIQDFQAINHACQSLDACPVQFKELAKKFLQGQVDKRSLSSVSDLMSQWESRSAHSGSLQSFSSYSTQFSK